MNILIFGGTRFMGKHLVDALLANNHQVTLATRGLTKDNYGDKVHRICVDRKNSQEIKEKLSMQQYDVIYDTIAYCSNEIRILLDNVKCTKYIMISTAAVYDLHYNTKEEDFNPYTKELIWCNREDDSYDEIKRLAECALVKKYPDVKAIMVRFPFVIGKDDYTKRLFFYVEHIMKQKPMHISNYTNQISFVHSEEAGKFLAYLATSGFSGPINGANDGTISIEEIAQYIKKKTNLSAIVNQDGEVAPYNGVPTYSINIDKAKELGYQFTSLKEWIFDLLDSYIKEISE